VPFVIGAAAAVVAVWMRRSLDETESFTRAQASAAPGTRGLRGLWQHRRAAAIVFGLTAGGAHAFYVCTTYAQKFLVNTTGFSTPMASRVNALTLLVFMLVQPLFGALSDRIGRRPLLLTFGVLGTLGAVPMLTALETATPARAVALLLAALLAVSCYTSINAVVKAELFPTEVRALGVALPYSLAVSLFGGTAEYVALWLKGLGHERWFYWYTTGVIALSLLVYVLMPDTRDHSQIVED
jgi:MHS family alpha-ketoglutarate permease-like MFS transporter